MKVSSKTTLKASLVGSSVGIVGWLMGAGDLMWPNHPQIAMFFLTLIVTVVFVRVLAEEDAVRTNPS